MKKKRRQKTDDEKAWLRREIEEAEKERKRWPKWMKEAAASWRVT